MSSTKLNSLPQTTQQEDVGVYKTFDSMNLSDQLLRGVFAYGFEKPSAIQQRAIVPMISGRDLIAQAQSGTGKTGTFSIGALQQIDASLKCPQVLMLAPTRELANQITDVVSSLSDFLNIRVMEAIGGTLVSENVHFLKSHSPQVIVGTPGRVFDLISRGALDTATLRVFVIDEADEMLSLGFKDQIYDIAVTLPKTTQIGLFSATLPPEVLEITNKFMNDPLHILVKKEEITLAGIRQFYVELERDEWKLETLCDLFEVLNIAQCVIFCNSRRRVIKLAEDMKDREFTVSAIHADIPQKERNAIMKEFRNGSSRVLIATDILARGIDVHSVSLVVNYDLPGNPEPYIHRIGRCGRFGRKGVAINFVTNRDVSLLRELETHYETEIRQLPEDVAKLL